MTAQITNGFSAQPPVGKDVVGLLPGAGHDPNWLVVAASYDTVGRSGDGSGAAAAMDATTAAAPSATGSRRACTVESIAQGGAMPNLQQIAKPDRRE